MFRINVQVRLHAAAHESLWLITLAGGRGCNPVLQGTRSSFVKVERVLSTRVSVVPYPVGRYRTPKGFLGLPLVFMMENGKDPFSFFGPCDVV